MIDKIQLNVKVGTILSAAVSAYLAYQSEGWLRFAYVALVALLTYKSEHQ